MGATHFFAFEHVRMHWQISERFFNYKFEFCNAKNTLTMIRQAETYKFTGNNKLLHGNCSVELQISTNPSWHIRFGLIYVQLAELPGVALDVFKNLD